jgi:mRNA-degrading endonuclease RelE of RelBE toxin-antitoxin system
MAYEIVVHELAVGELESLRAFDQRRILADIREQLALQPSVPTRRRKCLIDLTPSFEHDLPVWELRVGVFRVFYDVAEEEKLFHIRAVRQKRPPKKTEDIA